jgi:hypothetical protein
MFQSPLPVVGGELGAGAGDLDDVAVAEGVVDHWAWSGGMLMQPWETFKTPWSAKDHGAAVGDDPIQGTVVPEFDNQTAGGMAESYARSKLSSARSCRSSAD